MLGPFELLAVLAIIALLIGAWLRAGRGAGPFLSRTHDVPGHVPARFESGDAVVTHDGLLATFRRRAGLVSLLELERGTPVWVRTQSLQLDGRGARAPGADGHAPRPPEPLAPPKPHPPPPPALAASGAFVRLGELMYAHRRFVVAAWVALVACSAPFAFSVEHDLQPGGFIVQDGDAKRVMEQLDTAFDMPTTSATIVVPGTLADAEAKLAPARAQLLKLPHVTAVSPGRAAASGKRVAFDVGFSELDPKAMDTLPRLRTALAKAGFQRSAIQIAGSGAIAADTTEQAQRDLRSAEMFGLPAALFVLLIVFRTLVAALVPLAIGICTTVVSLAVLHGLALQGELSIYVLNIASMLALGLGIDYSLLGVTRYRMQRTDGADGRAATVGTIATAGRATVVSAIAVAAGLGALGVLPIMAMKSIAIAAVVVVAVSTLAACTLLPSLLALLGDRLEVGALPGRAARPVDQSRWYAFTKAVMRRPGTWLVVGIGALLLLAWPLGSARMEVPHGDVLSPSAPSQRAEHTLQTAFGERVAAPILIVTPSKDSDAVADLRRRIRALPHIVDVQARPAIDDSGTTLLVARGDRVIARGGEQARSTVGSVRKLAQRGGRDSALVGGVAAGEQEFMDEIGSAVPKIALIIFASIFVIIGVGFRSVWLPVKAVALDTLSIAGAFGLTLLVFQHGVGIELLGAEPLDYADATLPLILFCLLFGLSMDYEVFILARITELYQDGHDEQEATARGVAATAPLVTGAALILVVIGVAFARTDLVLIQQLGFGMAAALLIDATIVRAILLPAAMSVLGSRNWWMPTWLLRKVPASPWTH